MERFKVIITWREEDTVDDFLDPSTNECFTFEDLKDDFALYDLIEEFNVTNSTGLKMVKIVAYREIEDSGKYSYYNTYK